MLGLVQPNYAVLAAIFLFFVQVTIVPLKERLNYFQTITNVFCQEVSTLEKKKIISQNMYKNCIFGHKAYI